MQCKIEVNNHIEIFDIDKVAKQAAGAALLRVNNSVVLATVCRDETPADEDFLPLTVQYIEKMYAAGRIPGGYVKRETKPSDAETLSARIIDRSLRPLFPKGYTYPTQIVVYVLSADEETDLQVISLNAASMALYLSDIPVNSPVCGVRIGRINDEFVLNPSNLELKKSSLDLYLAGVKDELLMIEMRSLPSIKNVVQNMNEFSENLMLEAINFGADAILRQSNAYEDTFKNLKKAAQQITTEFGGELPNNYNKLITLPGIGPYTAGAIASIAFHEPVPAVDGNVMRVIARIMGDDSDITENKTKQEMMELVQQLIPVTEVHHFNQALMELGAIICLPNGEPKCLECPMSTMCIAYHTGIQNKLPVKKKKNTRKIEEKTVLLFLDEKEHILIQKREQKGLLHGLWEFPSLTYSVSLEECQSLFAPISSHIKKIVPLPSSKHIFTHIEWKMNGYFVFLNDKKPSSVLKSSLLPTISELPLSSETVWATIEELRKVYPLPTAFKTYRNALEEKERQGEQLNLFDSSW